MRLDRLDRRGLGTLERAVRGGEPVILGRGVHADRPLDELVPLVHEVEDPEHRRWLAPGARPGTGYRVSVIIPTHRTAPIGLLALTAQDVMVDVHILANGAYPGDAPGGAAVERVPWEGHGTTRQRAVERVASPYVLFTVDDALPLGAGFVRTLVEALEEGRYDAVYARQVPWPLADAVTRARLRAWTPPGDRHTSSVQLDHVAALHRRDLLLEDPLPDVPTAEDWVWSRRHRVGYVPTAPVVHAHPRHFAALYRRTRDIHAVRTAWGEASTVPDLRTLVGALLGTVGWDLPGALGELLGQYAGGRRRRG